MGVPRGEIWRIGGGTRLEFSFLLHFCVCLELEFAPRRDSHHHPRELHQKQEKITRSMKLPGLGGTPSTRAKVVEEGLARRVRFDCETRESVVEDGNYNIRFTSIYGTCSDQSNNNCYCGKHNCRLTHGYLIRVCEREYVLKLFLA